MSKYSHIVHLCHRYKHCVKSEKNQQDATIKCLLLTSVSTCFAHHYAHLQENKGPLTAFGVLFWFCWMWLIAVVGRCLVGCEHGSHPTTQRPTTATNHIQQNQRGKPYAVTYGLCSPEDGHTDGRNMLRQKLIVLASYNAAPHNRY